MRTWVSIGSIIVGIALVSLFLFQGDQRDPAVPVFGTNTVPMENMTIEDLDQDDAAPNRTVRVGASPMLRTIRSLDVPDGDRHFQFAASIPASWQVEAIPSIGALNLFDPDAPGNTPIEQSQIFIRYFEGSSFLTLSTVDIRSREETTINTRPAVTYEIEKKAGIADFPDQPSWRNVAHRVTDIQSGDDLPTTYYVFAQNPDLPTALFEAFLASVVFTASPPEPAPSEPAAIQFPMTDFKDRITKKSFGQYITPTNSPIRPERFTGYHTAVDAEVFTHEESIDVPVFAIADGVVTRAQHVNGYGGLVTIEHTIGDEIVTAVYGHVRLSSVAATTGVSVSQGEQVAVLGTGYSDEADGERKHLHFGLLRGSSSDIRGYVPTEGELSSWVDPLEWFSGLGVG